MAKAFARQTKLPNVVGRSDYIKDPKRQDKIVFHSEEHLHHAWQDYAEYEIANQKSTVANNQGREIIIALPHELENKKDKLKEVVDDYALSLLGKNRDFEYAVHWNKERTNLHAHIIYSERQRVNKRKPKKYKRDMWFDVESNKMAKAKAEGAELRYEKGDVMRDKKNGIRYESEPFTKKDKVFTTRDFNQQIKVTLKDILNKHGFKYRLFDSKKEVAQIHVGHQKSRLPLTYKKAQDYNKEVSQLNQFLKDNKTYKNYYFKEFKDLRINNKEDWELSVYELKAQVLQANIKIKNIKENIKIKNRGKDTLLKKFKRKKEIDSELYDLERKDYPGLKKALIPYDMISKKVLKEELEQLNVEKEMDEHFEAIAYLWTPPIDKEIEALQINLEDKQKEKERLKTVIRDRMDYKADYPREIERRTQVQEQRALAKAEAKQRETQLELMKEAQRQEKREQERSERTERNKNRPKPKKTRGPRL